MYLLLPDLYNLPQRGFLLLFVDGGELLNTNRRVNLHDKRFMAKKRVQASAHIRGGMLLSIQTSGAEVRVRDNVSAVVMYEAVMGKL